MPTADSYEGIYPAFAGGKGGMLVSVEFKQRSHCANPADKDLLKASDVDLSYIQAVPGNDLGTLDVPPPVWRLDLGLVGTEIVRDAM